MKCTNCGGEVAPNMKFCGVCGTPIKHTEAPIENTPVSTASKFDVTKLKKYAIPGILVIALIIVASIAWNIFKPSKYEQFASSFNVILSDDRVIVQPLGKTKTTIDGTLMDSGLSMDNTKAAFLVVEDSNSFYDNREGGTLYIADNKETKLIADDVYRMAISYSGDSVAFVQGSDGYVGTLCLYKGGKTTTISADFNVNEQFTISPDGKIVGYTVFDDDEYETIGYYYDGKQKELGRDITPLAIADGAKHIYYRKNGKLYVQRGEDGDTAVSLGEPQSIIGFNKDLSQIIFTAYTSNGSRSYISRNGDDKERLSGEATSVLLPYGTMRSQAVLGIDSFADTYYQTYDGEVYRIDGKFESTRVLGNAANPQLLADGKTIVFQNYSGDIEKIDGSKENAESVQFVDEEEIRFFVATDDGDEIYFLNYYDELYYQKGNNKPTLVGDVIGSPQIALYKGNKLFYVSDNELYASTGGKGTLVVGIDGGVEWINAGQFDIIVQTFGGDGVQTYHSVDGDKFELIDQY